ncbi:threonine--tRNA ligase 1 [Oxobacter pfennigii]|uniref:Threonine--tRNA ligase 1 n=1 Tax=Oxobacter pfennigii TaxID=36849 RepID=A0A0P8WRX1_9CLOT|nr:nucleoside kinase [Oxobacter pfennigii]KPU45329.1 threonine--tRNA ligase 1 [Oxobacter pfennigii]
MDKVKVEFNSGLSGEYAKGTRLKDIAKNYKVQYETGIIAAKVNNEILELNDELNEDCKVEFLTLASYEARRIYARGLTFVLIRAAQEIFPDCKVSIEHSINKGLYGEIHKDKELSLEDVLAIERRMQEIVESDEPFEKSRISMGEAINLFKKSGQDDKVRLFKYWKQDHINLYKCGWLYDYFYGRMVPSAGYLKKFELKFYKPGFVLSYPETYSPDELPVYIEQKKLFNVFRETEEWAKIIGVSDVGELNEKEESGDIEDIIRIAEALHEKKIANIADMIADFKDKIKIVLIAGPSSSGKTTFTKRLSIQLRVNGLKPYAISLDDYFLNREDTPKDENGDYDFETIYALDLNLLNDHLQRLLNGEEIMIPTFNFITGQREYKGNTLKLTDGMILLAEGIHGLNEMLTSKINPENKFKIYISALTQLNIDNHNRIPTTDVRILRRIIRDNRTRGRDAESTILGWPSVRKGEDINIFPFQEEADIMFNSTLLYEMGVLKNYAEPLLKKIGKESRAYSEARRLLKFLEYFLPVDDTNVPNNSIIREFTGKSSFYNE